MKRGQSLALYSSLPRCCFLLHFLHTSMLSSRQDFRRCLTSSLNTMVSFSRGVPCAPFVYDTPSFHTLLSNNDLSLQDPWLFYLLIITDTVFTLGLKEQRPFPDSDLESIMKTCSCNIDMHVTADI